MSNSEKHDLEIINKAKKRTIHFSEPLLYCVIKTKTEDLEFDLEPFVEPTKISIHVPEVKIKKMAVSVIAKNKFATITSFCVENKNSQTSLYVEKKKRYIFCKNHKNYTQKYELYLKESYVEHSMLEQLSIHNITPLYYGLGFSGKDVHVSFFHEYFNTDLAHFLKKQVETQTVSKVEKIASKIWKIVFTLLHKAITETNLFFIDLKPQNVVIREQKGDFEIRLIDIEYAFMLITKLEKPGNVEWKCLVENMIFLFFLQTFFIFKVYYQKNKSDSWNNILDSLKYQTLIILGPTTVRKKVHRFINFSKMVIRAQQTCKSLRHTYRNPWDTLHMYCFTKNEKKRIAGHLKQIEDLETYLEAVSQYILDLLNKSLLKTTIKLLSPLRTRKGSADKT